MDNPIGEILEAWATNQRINVLLLDAISPEGLACTLSTRGGRSVARQMAHVHNVRIYQLDARAKDLAKGLEKFATKDEPSRTRLKRALNASSKRIARFLKDSADGKPKRRCFRKGVVPFLGYLISHESHHRGNILLTLKQCGHAPDKDVRYKVWDWDRI